MNDGRLDPFFMFFTRFYYSLSSDEGRIRLGIKRNWNETEIWLEKRSTPFFPPAPVTSPPKRKRLDIPVLPSHSFPPDLSYWEKVQAYGWKSSTLEAVVTSVSLLSRQNRQNRQRQDYTFDRKWIICIYLGIEKSQNWENFRILFTDIHVISFYCRASTWKIRPLPS